MHWSRAPVFGQLPARGVRSHTVTLVDNMVWLFGGWDGRTSWQEVFCFNTETMQWTYPKLSGEIPKPCRAHSATLVDQKIYVFGGGEHADYYNDVYVLDTVMRRWHRPLSSATPENERTCVYPPPRRSHTCVFYNNRLWIFGGGTGTMALDDLWALDLSGGIDDLRWDRVETRGKKPRPRGYHTANLIGNVMVVIGGGDIKDIFSDIWCLNLDTLLWSVIRVGEYHQRLGHTATQVGSYLFIFGGHDGRYDYRQDLLLFNLVSLQYEPRLIAGKPPASRGYHAACLADGRVFIFGGFDGTETLEDVCILDLAGAAYLQQVTSFRIDV
ncbi:galactose oxidase [Trametes gibbosa]|nr:galactose oxidase [Trametes gibbosa]